MFVIFTGSSYCENDSHSKLHPTWRGLTANQNESPPAASAKNSVSDTVYCVMTFIQTFTLHYFLFQPKKKKQLP